MLLVHVVILHRVGEIKATSERSLSPGGSDNKQRTTSWLAHVVSACCRYLAESFFVVDVGGQAVLFR